MEQQNLPSLLDAQDFSVSQLFASDERRAALHWLWIVWTLAKYLEKDKLWLDLLLRHLVAAGAPGFAGALAPALPLTLPLLLLPLRPAALISSYLLLLSSLLRVGGALVLQHCAAHGTAEALQRPLHRATAASFRHCTITAPDHTTILLHWSAQI